MWSRVSKYKQQHSSNIAQITAYKVCGRFMFVGWAKVLDSGEIDAGGKWDGLILDWDASVVRAELERQLAERGY